MVKSWRFLISILLLCTISLHGQLLDLKEIYSFKEDITAIYLYGSGIAIKTKQNLYLLDTLGEVRILDELHPGSIAKDQQAISINPKMSKEDSITAAAVQTAIPYQALINFQLVYNDTNCYALNQNKVYWFRKHPYLSVYRPNLSFRSSLFLGEDWHIFASYNGFYINDERVTFLSPNRPPITYSNGRIKNINDTIYIAWKGLLYSADKFISYKEYRPFDYSYNQYTDLGILGNRKFFIRQRGVENDQHQVIFKAAITASFFTENHFYTGDDSGVLSRHFLDSAGQYQNEILFDFAEKIVSIYPTQKSLLITTEHNLYNYSAKENKLLASDEKIIYADAIADSTGSIWLATYQGLFKYHGKDQLETIIPDVEFNKRGLNYFKGKIYAGSTTGLYSIELAKYIPQAAQKFYRPFNAIDELLNKKQSFHRLLYIGLSLLALSFAFWLFKKHRQKNNELHTNLDIENIRSAILENPSINSVKSLAAHFDTYPMDLYRSLEGTPLTPGNLIKETKNELVQELLNKRSSLKEISKKTGYSEKYLARKYRL